MKRFLIAFLVLSLGVMAGPAAADTLWYNGDFNGSGYSMTNHHQYQDYGGGVFYQSDSHVYDDFVVPKGAGRLTPSGLTTVSPAELWLPGPPGRFVRGYPPGMGEPWWHSAAAPRR